MVNMFLNKEAVSWLDDANGNYAEAYSKLQFNLLPLFASNA